MKVRYKATAEWLRRVAGSYYHPERLYDAKLIHDLLFIHNHNEKHEKKRSFEYLHKLPQPELKPQVFQDELDLPPIPKNPVPESEINEVLELPEGIIPGYTRPQTFEEQINRLLFPQWIKDGTWKPDSDVLEKSLTKKVNYTIRRMIVGGFPINYKWLENPPGIDRLTAALISTHLITKMIGVKIPWEEVLRKVDPSEAISVCNIINLRPDGPLAINWQNHLARLRRHINVLYHPVVGPLCSHLSKENKPRRIVSKDISEILEINERKAWEIRNHLSLILTERFIPSISILGLRYRYIVNFRVEDRLDETPIFIRSEFRSFGVLMQMLGFELFRDEKDKVRRLPVDIQIHLEPTNSEFPVISEKSDSINMTLDSESISFRLDLFNSNQKPPWKVNLSSRGTFPTNEPSWLKRELGIRKATTITQRQAELLGVLWAHRGSYTSRQRLIKLLGYPKRTVNYSLKMLLKKEVLSVLYHPAIELSGLPELIMFIVRDAPIKKIRKISRWFLGTLPYVHLKKSKDGRNLVAFLRMPLNMWDSANQVRDKLIEEVDIRMVFIKKSRSYFMSFPSRLFDHQNQTWKNPWDI